MAIASWNTAIDSFMFGFSRHLCWFGVRLYIPYVTSINCTCMRIYCGGLCKLKWTSKDMHILPTFVIPNDLVEAAALPRHSHLNGNLMNQMHVELHGQCLLFIAPRQFQNAGSGSRSAWNVVAWPPQRSRLNGMQGWKWNVSMLSTHKSNNWILRKHFMWELRLSIHRISFHFLKARMSHLSPWKPGIHATNNQPEISTD